MMRDYKPQLIVSIPFVLQGVFQCGARDPHWAPEKTSKPQTAPKLSLIQFSV